MQFHRVQTGALVTALIFILALAGCSDNDGNAAGFDALPIANPTVSMPPDAGGPNLLAQTFSLADVGYEQAEYFLEGTATAFRNVNEFAADGNWQAEPAGEANYRTRILVYRPSDPADFNGRVLMEWLNVTAGFETPPSWGTGQLEMRRGGSVWIGVSAQLVGIEGSDRGLVPLHLKAVNPDRYGSLVHPGDSFSYDIFSQAAQAVREPVGIDPLGGLDAQYLIAYGESQS
ncbi:MAG: alpha/beta hydrolase domain-containing protein, partial [Halioglobus sp.]|nr:alpha/beta hydrolase domain-containing protein [Halioglobus sp.]